jgi:hypothetical protein
MLVSFHLIAFLVNEYLTQEWQKNVRDITREVVDATVSCKSNATEIRGNSFFVLANFRRNIFELSEDVSLRST